MDRELEFHVTLHDYVRVVLDLAIGEKTRVSEKCGTRINCPYPKPLSPLLVLRVLHRIAGLRDGPLYDLQHCLYNILTRRACDSTTLFLKEQTINLRGVLRARVRALHTPPSHARACQPSAITHGARCSHI
ncbi:hypothetical protein J6590_003272 [Homalodisca vitripennis]|nr:hypothetical protein J6590_003272 [Homalodisca vitripennis]